MMVIGCLLGGHIGWLLESYIWRLLGCHIGWLLGGQGGYIGRSGLLGGQGGYWEVMVVTGRSGWFAGRSVWLFEGYGVTIGSLKMVIGRLYIVVTEGIVWSLRGYRVVIGRYVGWLLGGIGWLLGGQGC